MKRLTQQADVIEQASDGYHVKAYGKNFKPLIAAGSWTISGFHYGRSKCACCGRPIYHVLHLKNESHEDSVKVGNTDSKGQAFPETIEIGIVCGPKVFTESCIGFYDDPTREWERQIRSWKDYINYVVLCVKNTDTWARVPEQLRNAVDQFLEEGYKKEDHTGPWWIVKDAKKKFLKIKRPPGVMPEARVLYSYARTLVYAAKRLELIPVNLRLEPDMTLVQDLYS